MSIDAVTWQRIVLLRLYWQARRPCDLCRPCWPCETARYCWLLVDAASIALDNAVAAEHPATGWRERQAAIWEMRAEETIRGSVAWA